MAVFLYNYFLNWFLFVIYFSRYDPDFSNSKLDSSGLSLRTRQVIPFTAQSCFLDRGWVIHFFFLDCWSRHMKELPLLVVKLEQGSQVLLQYRLKPERNFGFGLCRSCSWECGRNAIWRKPVFVQQLTSFLQQGKSFYLFIHGGPSAATKKLPWHAANEAAVVSIKTEWFIFISLQLRITKGALIHTFFISIHSFIINM